MARWLRPASYLRRSNSRSLLIVGRMLQLYPDVRLDRVILSASILGCTFPWSQFGAGRIGKVMNEHCPSDSVVPLSLIYRLQWLPTGLSDDMNLIHPEHPPADSKPTLRATPHQASRWITFRAARPPR